MAKRTTRNRQRLAEAHKLGTPLATRNSELYGCFRESPDWSKYCAAPAGWKFSAIPEINRALAEVWSLVAETHLVHYTCRQLAPTGLRTPIGHEEAETARIVEKVLNDIMSYAHQFPETAVNAELFSLSEAGFIIKEPL